MKKLNFHFIGVKLLFMSTINCTQYELQQWISGLPPVLGASKLQHLSGLFPLIIHFEFPQLCQSQYSTTIYTIPTKLANTFHHLIKSETSHIIPLSMLEFASMQGKRLIDIQQTLSEGFQGSWMDEFGLWYLVQWICN